MTIKINDYAEFVDETTSDASKHHIALIGRLDDLKSIANIPRLLTASVGMLAESGEFAPALVATENGASAQDQRQRFCLGARQGGTGCSRYREW